MDEQTKPLSKREQEVLGWLKQGKQNHEIAETLSVAAVTVEKHLTSIYRKLGVRSRVEAVLHDRLNNG